MSGTVLVLVLLALTVPNLISPMRRLAFELFYVSHVILALAVIVFGIMHSVSILYLALAWWLLDLGTRYLYMSLWRYPRVATIRNLPCDVIEISFPKPEGFDYKAGQFLQVCIPKLSVYQFHPFSLSSAPHQDIVTIHIRVLGDWTKRLQKLADKHDTIRIYIEGPFGSLAVDLESKERYKIMVLVSGGIGITPMQSLCNSLVYDHEERGRPLKLLYFIWSVRDKAMADALHDHDNATGTTLPGHHRLGQTEEQTRLSTRSFQPDLLTEVASSPLVESKHGEVEMTNLNPPAAGKQDEFLHTEFYLTGAKEKDADAVTSPHVLLGRPDMDHILQKVKQVARDKGEHRVAVCVCGPAPLVEACRNACRQYSDRPCDANGIVFDPHEETFDL